MEFVIRISERTAVLILVAIVAVSSTGLVLAYGGSIPSEMGHTWGEMDCSDCVVAGNIASGAVGSPEILDGSVGRLDIADDSVDSSKLSADSVGASEIADDAVGESELASDSVGSSEIKSGGVRNSDLYCPCGTCWATRNGNCNPGDFGYCLEYREVCTPGGWIRTSGTLEEGGSPN